MSWGHETCIEKCHMSRTTDKADFSQRQHAGKKKKRDSIYGRVEERIPHSESERRKIDPENWRSGSRG